MTFITFCGSATISTFRLITAKAQYRGLDFLEILQECGPRALPIVSLISFLFGLILSYVGAAQLAMFGATIYVADLVTIGMLREMGAIMTAIIMAGRTGAAFAAQLGTMKVTQEIDALKTMAISPLEFLILPRMVALILMMPLLTLFANVVGMIGGALVTVGTSDVTFTQYFIETKLAFHFSDLYLGLFKSVIFGIVIAFCGCLEGMNCGGSASAVGDATTRAVVKSITWIIALDGLFAIMTNALGI